MGRNSGHPFSEAHRGYLINEADGSVDACSDDPVHVAIVVDVQGYGPHHGAMYVDQNRYHGSVDSALEAAYEMQESWMQDHFGDQLKELEKERLEDHVNDYLDAHPNASKDDAIDAVQDAAYQEADEWFRSNMDGVTWTMTAAEFIEAVDAWPSDRSRKVLFEGITITREEECD